VKISIRIACLLALASFFYGPYSEAKDPSKTPFRCDIAKPALTAGKLSSCSDSVAWSYGLDEIRKSNPELFEKTVQEQVAANPNVGSGVFTLPDGTKKTIYRSSFLSNAPACIKELVSKGGVRSVVNLYNMGDLESHTQLSIDEKAQFQKAGAQVYTDILNYQYKFKEVKKERIIDKVAEIVSVVQSVPGNVLMHCYGGMHRTGLVFAVMQKCFNKVPLAQVLNEYHCHVAYENEERAGGRSKDNEEVIRDFPCDKLSP